MKKFHICIQLLEVHYSVTTRVLWSLGAVAKEKMPLLRPILNNRA